MIKALQNAASGMAAQQRNVDTIANNIANINTLGYIKNRVDFKDAIYSTMINPENPNSAVNLQQGNGVLLSGTSKIYSPALHFETDNPLDFSITGDGFFVIENEDGELSYTRDGSFKISHVDGDDFLVNSNGHFVLDSDLQRIQLYDNINAMKVDKDGFITFGEDYEPSARLGIVDFPNKSGLEAAGGNLLLETVASGQPALVEHPGVKQKSLEGSNVNLTDEISQLIKAQRAYQIAAKAINTVDDMESIANNMRN